MFIRLNAVFLLFLLLSVDSLSENYEKKYLHYADKKITIMKNEIAYMEKNLEQLNKEHDLIKLHYEAAMRNLIRVKISETDDQDLFARELYIAELMLKEEKEKDHKQLMAISKLMSEIKALEKELESFIVARDKIDSNINNKKIKNVYQKVSSSKTLQANIVSQTF